MVVKDIVDESNNIKLLIEEQIVGNKRYKIIDSYVPKMCFEEKRITVSKIDETSFDHYEEIHGLKLADGKVKSIYLVDDKNKSTHDSYFLEDELGYYEEVISLFDELINLGLSEFSDKAINVYIEIKEKAKNKGVK